MEALNIQRAVFEVNESVNQAYDNNVCSGFSCLDGASVNDVAGGQPIGRIFRDHVWVAQDGFSSGYLPTTNRIKYLAEAGKIPANSPAFAVLPKELGGARPETSSIAHIYADAKKSAEDKGLTTCSSDGKNGCSINCAQPSAGWQGQFCAAKTVQHWSCSDSYAVNAGGSWQPTKDATVPYTAKGNYSNKTWKWPDIFAWNSPAMGNVGGAVYMCNSTINAWVTQKATYACRVPATYDCSYDGADADGRPTSFSGSCETCSPDMGAKWDFILAQANDCPITPASTRASSSRTMWQGDLIATSCPVNGSGVASAPPACQGGQVLGANGSTCACKPGHSWSGSTCLPPPRPGTPPELNSSSLALSNSVEYRSAVMGTLAGGVQILSISLAAGSPFPPNMFLHSSGNLVMATGTPTRNGSYSVSVKAEYANGVDASGNKYPAGSAKGTMLVTVTGCPPATLSWTGSSGDSCAGLAGKSALYGTTQTLSVQNGSATASCSVAGGDWSLSATTCSAPPCVESTYCQVQGATFDGYSSCGGTVVWGRYVCPNSYTLDGSENRAPNDCSSIGLSCPSGYGIGIRPN